jgi:hypothetical protein
LPLVVPLPPRSFKSYPQPKAGTLAELHEQILSDISEVVFSRLRKFGGEFPQVIDPNADTGQKMV